ncbi:hypothetical protein D3C78_1100030 [compost metagenome]
MLLGLVDQLVQERRRPEADGDLLALDDLQRLGGVPAIHEHRARVPVERQLEAAEAGDVGHRRGHQQGFRAAAAPVLEGALEAGRPGVVRMQHGLGSAGGAGGVEDQLDRIGIHHRLRHRPLALGEHRLVAVGTGRLAAHRAEQAQLRQIRRQTLHHRGVVEVAVGARKERRLDRRVGEHEGDLGIPVDRHDRRHHQSQQAGRQVDDRGLAPVGQLEADHVAGHQATALQGAGQQAGIAEQLADPAGHAFEDMGDLLRVACGHGRGPLGDGLVLPLAAAGIAGQARLVQANLAATDIFAHAYILLLTTCGCARSSLKRTSASTRRNG